MIKNYYYLIVGVLCILFAVTHTTNGTGVVLPVLFNSGMNDDLITTIIYVWHIIGVENLVIGIALIIMAFSKNLSGVSFTAWLIIAILGMRWITITVFTLTGGSPLKQIIPDTVAMFLLIALLILGTRVRSIPKE